MDNYRYAGLNKNDTSAGAGFSVTFFAQGCPHHCEGCYNPETWSFNEGKPFTQETMQEILVALTANGINRNLCLMGGEPLCPENRGLILNIITTVKKHLPKTKIYIWTGYLFEELVLNGDTVIRDILAETDYLIDGPFLKEQKDITLKMRGSRNQRILNLKPFDK